MFKILKDLKMEGAWLKERINHQEKILYELLKYLGLDWDNQSEIKIVKRKKKK